MRSKKINIMFLCLLVTFLWAVYLMFQKKYISSILILIYSVLILINNVILRNVEEYLKEDELENVKRYGKISSVLGLFEVLIMITVGIILPMFGVE